MQIITSFIRRFDLKKKIQKTSKVAGLDFLSFISLWPSLTQAIPSLLQHQHMVSMMHRHKPSFTASLHNETPVVVICSFSTTPNQLSQTKADGLRPASV